MIGDPTNTVRQSGHARPLHVSCKECFCLLYLRYGNFVSGLNCATPTMWILRDVQILQCSWVEENSL